MRCDITKEATHIKRIIKEWQEQFYADVFDSLGEMEQMP